jgi:hypothetical protein
MSWIVLYQMEVVSLVGLHQHYRGMISYDVPTVHCSTLTAVKDSPLKFVSLVNNRMAHCCYYKTCLLMTTLVLAPPF